MSISKSLFGHMPDGRPVFNYTLIDDKGQSVTVSEYGCAIVETKILGTDGNLHDVTLGYDSLEEYINDRCSFGVIVGRYANRIKNGMFTLNGVTYHLPRNYGMHTLHGGPEGFRKKLFSSEANDDTVVFTLVSPDLDQGFPGNFTITETVSFKDGAFRMSYDYVCDKDTPANITNHNYFNLNGNGTGCIFNHSVKLNSEKYCQANEYLLAQAPAVSVEGTPFDFRKPKKIINGIFTYSPEIVAAGGGFDHCFEIKDYKKPCAVVTGDVTGIKMEVYTDMPAMHFYTGNSIGHVKGKGGAQYNSFDGFAVECEQFPNSINEPSFPNTVIKAGEHKSEFIEFRFSC